LFSIKRGNAKNIAKRAKNVDGVALVSAKDKNNGVNFTTMPEKNETIYKNILTINNNGSVGCSYYHPYNFIATSDVTILNMKEDISKYAQSFVSTLLQKFTKKYAYGYKISNSRLKKQPIMIPIDAVGEPNWQFMEDYVKVREEKKRLLVLKYCKEQLNLCLSESAGARLRLDNIKWKAFKIEDVFEIIERGKRLTKKMQEKGNVPYISSSALNNGVDNFISNEKNVRRYKDALTVANSGSVASSFYHIYEYVASDHVTNLKTPNGNRESYLFISVIIKKLKEKYSFNREMADDRIRKELILLPASSSGKPDFLFMKHFILQEEARLYKKIIARFGNI